MRTLAYALALGATIYGFLGDVNTAQTWSDELHDLSSRYSIAYLLATVAGIELFLPVMMSQPVPPGLAEETLRVARASGNPWVLAMAYNLVGRLEMATGHWAEAASLLEEGASLFHKIRDRSMYTGSRSEMGHLLRMQGNFPEAAVFYAETIQVYQEMSEYAAVAHELECFAFIAAAQGRSERAARLLGAAEALRERLNTDMTPIERREYEAIVSNLRAATNEEFLAKAWFEGRGMTTEQAIQLALEPYQGG